MLSCEADATSVGTLMLAYVDFVLIHGCHDGLGPLIRGHTQQNLENLVLKGSLLIFYEHVNVIIFILFHVY